MKLIRMKTKSDNQRGATLVLIAICIFVFIAFAALAIDIGHLVVTRNELQNAADAGALAGAAALYLPGLNAVNEGANIAARDVAMANKSEKVAVEVSETVDVQRGHWNNIARVFTANPATELPAISGPIDEAAIAADTRFVNAVWVRSNRNSTPVASFFARIFGFESFVQDATAIAYLGFTASLNQMEADFPIVICCQSVRGPDCKQPYDCKIGRMINSGSDQTTHNTAGWTDFNQENPCQGATNASTMRNLAAQACTSRTGGTGINPNPVIFGENITTQGGEIQNVLTRLANCFRGSTTPWKITVPVVDCPQNNVGPCEKVVGAITIDIMAINDEQNDNDFSNVPSMMTVAGTSWNNNAPGTLQGWQSYAAAFGLPSEYLGKTIYFRPGCEGEYVGNGGGTSFFNVFPATGPVLVE